MPWKGASDLFEMFTLRVLLIIKSRYQRTKLHIYIYIYIYMCTWIVLEVTD